MKKVIQTLGLSLCVMILMMGTTNAQQGFRHQSIDPGVINKQISDTKSEWIQRFLVDDIIDYGFANYKEANNAVAGQAIELYDMYTTKDGITNIVSNGEFYIPLLIDGEARVFLKMANHEGKYQIVAHGEMTLAQDAASYIRQHTSGSNVRLIWIQNLNHNADFIATVSNLTEDSDMVCTPIFTAQRAGFSQPIAFSTLLEMISSMPVYLD